MEKINQFLLAIAIFCWSLIIGAVIYSHLAYFPSLVSNLPDSSVLANGPYKINDELFWKIIHPITIIFTTLSLYFNWKNAAVRKPIAIAMFIYVIALMATFTYFVPELIAFFNSNINKSVTSAEWISRGERWIFLSWVRGVFMIIGFLMLLRSFKKA